MARGERSAVPAPGAMFNVGYCPPNTPPVE